MSSNRPYLKDIDMTTIWDTNCWNSQNCECDSIYSDLCTFVYGVILLMVHFHHIATSNTFRWLIIISEFYLNLWKQVEETTCKFNMKMPLVGWHVNLDIFFKYGFLVASILSVNPTTHFLNTKVLWEIREFLIIWVLWYQSMMERSNIHFWCWIYINKCWISGLQSNNCYKTIIY